MVAAHGSTVARPLEAGAGPRRRPAGGSLEGGPPSWPGCPEVEPGAPGREDLPAWIPARAAHPGPASASGLRCTLPGLRRSPRRGSIMVGDELIQRLDDQLNRDATTFLRRAGGGGRPRGGHDEDGATGRRRVLPRQRPSGLDPAIGPARRGVVPSRSAGAGSAASRRRGPGPGLSPSRCRSRPGSGGGPLQVQGHVALTAGHRRAGHIPGPGGSGAARTGRRYGPPPR